MTKLTRWEQIEIEYEYMVKLNLELNSKLESIVNEFCELMDNSQGVSGLHLNGDIATWNWLRNNGWLYELDKHLGE